MNKYTKNKNFIPEKFHYKMKLKEKKAEMKLIALFLIINLYLLPRFCEDIKKNYEKPYTTVTNIKQSNVNLDNVTTWIKSTFNDDIEEVYITNDNGEIIVEGLDKIDNLKLDDSIAVNDISLNNDKKYKLGVSLNE